MIPPIESQADQNSHRTVHANVVKSLHNLCNAQTVLLFPAHLCLVEYVVLAQVSPVELIAPGVLFLGSTSMEAHLGRMSVKFLCAWGFDVAGTDHHIFDMTVYSIYYQGNLIMLL